MSNQGCDFDKTRVVAYLYEECDGDERRLVEAHLAGCGVCSGELAGFRGLQASLQHYAPPEQILGFRVTRQPETVARRWWWPLPVWAQAASAVVVLMVGAAAANLEVRVGRDGVVVRTGWSEATPERAASAPVGGGTAADVRPAGTAPWVADLAALRQEIRAEIEARAGQPVAAAVSTAVPADEARILAQVRELVRESEDRQRSELFVRLAGTFNEFDRRHRADLVRLQDSFGQLEGRTGIEVARTNSMLQYLMRASQSGATIIK